MLNHTLSLVQLTRTVRDCKLCKKSWIAFIGLESRHVPPTGELTTFRRTLCTVHYETSCMILESVIKNGTCMHVESIKNCSSVISNPRTDLDQVPGFEMRTSRPNNPGWIATCARRVVRSSHNVHNTTLLCALVQCTPVFALAHAMASNTLRTIENIAPLESIWY